MEHPKTTVIDKTGTYRMSVYLFARRREDEPDVMIQAYVKVVSGQHIEFTDYRSDALSFETMGTALMFWRLCGIPEVVVEVRG
jgi:hypothetical protein